ncbi:DUF6292 family protein [Stackebrandtia soli]|uniref:DUF6292 family protein n=1 Tax=Stackebrandtia soli TaxID=1892856 RepID=UPI0039EC50D8
MSTQQHYGYIRAVRDAVIGRGINAGPATTTDSPTRTGTFALISEHTEKAFPETASVDVHWNPTDGWTCRPHYAPHTKLGESPIHMGLGRVPEPERVALWVDVALTTPAVVISRELHGENTGEDVEALLASHEATR